MGWSRVRCGEECVAVHLAASGTTSRSASTSKSLMPAPSPFMACVPLGVNRLATARAWLWPAMEATAAAISDEAHRYRAPLPCWPPLSHGVSRRGEGGFSDRIAHQPYWPPSIAGTARDSSSRRSRLGNALFATSTNSRSLRDSYVTAL